MLSLGESAPSAPHCSPLQTGTLGWVQGPQSPNEGACWFLPNSLAQTVPGVRYTPPLLPSAQTHSAPQPSGSQHPLGTHLVVPAPRDGARPQGSRRACSSPASLSCCAHGRAGLPSPCLPFHLPPTRVLSTWGGRDQGLDAGRGGQGPLLHPLSAFHLLIC